MTGQPLPNGYRNKMDTPKIKQIVYISKATTGLER